MDINWSEGGAVGVVGAHHRQVLEQLQAAQGRAEGRVRRKPFMPGIVEPHHRRAPQQLHNSGMWCMAYPEQQLGAAAQAGTGVSKAGREDTQDAQAAAGQTL